MSDSPRATAVKRWVWKLKEPPTMKVLLLALADNINEESGMAWPKMETLAEKCTVSRATVIRYLEEAVQKGYITKEARSRKGNLGQTSNGYRFPMTDIPASQSATLPEYQNDTQPEAELQIDMGQSSKLQRPELQNDTPRTFPNTLPQSDPLGTSSPSLSDSPKARGASPVKKSDAPLGPITEELVLAYAGRWTADEVRERIDYALNHAASKKWLNRDIGLRRWLKRDADSEDERRGNRGTSPPRNGTGPPAATQKGLTDEEVQKYRYKPGGPPS